MQADPLFPLRSLLSYVRACFNSLLPRSALPCLSLPCLALPCQARNECTTVVRSVDQNKQIHRYDQNASNFNPREYQNKQNNRDTNHTRTKVATKRKLKANKQYKDAHMDKNELAHIRHRNPGLRWVELARRWKSPFPRAKSRERLY